VVPDVRKVQKIVFFVNRTPRASPGDNSSPLDDFYDNNPEIVLL